MDAEVLVIGAGMAGLAAGRHLTKSGKDTLVLEKNPRVGGRVFTDTVEGFKIDAGAQFMANFYTHTLKFIQELGLQADLVPIPGISAILRSKRLYHVWPDLRLAFTPLISMSSKLLLLKPVLQIIQHWQDLDLHAFHCAYPMDVRSITDYSRQTLNEELLEYVFQPPLSGIFYWTPEHTSQAMLFLLLKAGLNIKLYTLKHGFGSLAQAMASSLNLIQDAQVYHVEPLSSDRYRVWARVQGEDTQIMTRAIVCATPASMVPALFPTLTVKQRDFFQAIDYSINTIAAFGVNRRLPSSYYGLLFPRQETRYLATAAIQSAKNPAKLPSGKDLLVLYPNGAAGQDFIHEDDNNIRNKLLADLKLAGADYALGTDEIFMRVYRWEQALPLFDVGHFHRLHHFSRGEFEFDRIVFAGDYLGGPFLEGAITSGLDAAQRLLDRW